MDVLTDLKDSRVQAPQAVALVLSGAARGSMLTCSFR